MHHSELRIACAWQRPPSALIPLQTLIACPSPLSFAFVAFVDDAHDVSEWALAARTGRDLGQALATLWVVRERRLGLEVTLGAAAAVPAFLQAPQPALNEAHTLLSLRGPCSRTCHTSLHPCPLRPPGRPAAPPWPGRLP